MTGAPFPGGELRERREALGLREDDVYRKIRISANFIRAIEEGDIEHLPALTYSVGFLRTYCRLLELNPEPYIHDLTTAMRPSRSFLGLRDSSTPLKRPAWWSDAVAWASICAILVAGWLAYSLVVRPSSSPQDTKVRAEEAPLYLPETEDRP